MALFEEFDPSEQFPPGTPPVPPITVDLAGETGDFALLGAFSEFTSDLFTIINSELADRETRLANFANRVGSTITNTLGGFGATVDGALRDVERSIETQFGGVAAGLENTIRDIEDGIVGDLITQTQDLTNVIGEVDTRIQRDLETKVGGLEGLLDDVGNKVTRGIGEVLDTVDGVVDPIINTITSDLTGKINIIEERVSGPLAVLTESLPQQVLNLGNVLETGLGTILDLPEALGGQLSGVFQTLSETLGLDQLLDFFRLVGRVVATVNDRISLSPDLETVPGSWDVPRSVTDQINVVLAAIPIIGSIIQTDHPAEFERIRLNSFEHTRPLPLDSGSVLEFIRRFPDEIDEVIGNLSRQGLGDDKIQSLLRIQHTPLPVLDNLDAWRRGEIEEVELDPRLRANGLSPDDMALAKVLSARIPPIQDLILFAVRGVFDIEESRRFGEFEGLPATLEERFIGEFGIEGGDFSRQVEVFSQQAQRLGLPPEWVAAYWTSHWRLPSLRSAYEMFHRLAPDIIEAEADQAIADGFDPESLKFDRASLDRLVRSADFSSFWRDKLSAIAFNPLTRVDIRRMHKLGILDDAATKRAYRKVGFSPSDADKMLAFTIAFNAEPDKTQTDEIRDLTKAQILDFVENDLFTPDEGVTALKEIGYDDFAAEGFVSLELAKRDRNLQRTAIDLIQERVLAGLIDINQASTQLDSNGVGPGQKAIILTELDVKLAKRNRQPTRAELDSFVESRIITAEEYGLGLSALGYADEWVARFVLLNAPGG